LTYHYTQPASASFQSDAPAGAQHNLYKLTRPNWIVKRFFEEKSADTEEPEAQWSVGLKNPANFVFFLLIS
jgi:hypothetical protein